MRTPPVAVTHQDSRYARPGGVLVPGGATAHTTPRPRAPAPASNPPIGDREHPYARRGRRLGGRPGRGRRCAAGSRPVATLVAVDEVGHRVSLAPGAAPAWPKIQAASAGAPARAGSA